MRFAALLLLVGCASAVDGPSVVIDGDEDLVPAPDWEQYRQEALATGGDSGLYVVEGDLVFSTEQALRHHYDELQESADKLALIQQLSTGFEPTFRGTAPLRLRYCVTNNGFVGNKNNVVAAVAAATRAWQSIVNVRFTYDASQDASCDVNNSSVDFAVVLLPFGGADTVGCASSKLLWDEVLEDMCLGAGTLGLAPESQIDSAKVPNQNLTLTGVVRHELGHILGFRHEHPWAANPGQCLEKPTEAGFDLTGRQLTPYDQFSVMHYAQCNGISGRDFTITTNDGIGARKIYGMPASWYVATLGVQAWF